MCARKRTSAQRGTAASGVVWFEEPVYHRDFEGLTLLRDRAPALIN